MLMSNLLACDCSLIRMGGHGGGYGAPRLSCASRGEQVGLTAERPADTLKEDSSAGESEATAILDNALCHLGI